LKIDRIVELVSGNKQTMQTWKVTFIVSTIYDIVGMYLTYVYRSITNAFYSRRVANQYHIYI